MKESTDSEKALLTANIYQFVFRGKKGVKGELIREKILRYLATHPNTCLKDLIEYLGIDGRYVKSMLFTLQNLDLIDVKLEIQEYPNFGLIAIYVINITEKGRKIVR